jgi:hypothetical protein
LAWLWPTRLIAQGGEPLAKGAAALDSASRVTRTVGGFVDGYYAWDFNRPPLFDRQYTTQPARHAEFNINLAYVDLKLDASRYRGRLALQFGTSVQSNYAGESRIGNVSGPSVSQFIQEATAGYRLTPTLWIDGGVFFSHIGYEGWISRDNIAYTRSLIADFSPYYQSGVKATWSALPTVTATFALVNGWQVVSNYNTPPAAGIRLDVAASPKLTLTYDNFIGNMAADSAEMRLRVYHDFVAQYTPNDRWRFATALAFGSQSNSTPTGGIATWWGGASFAKYRATSALSLVGRIERYSDPQQVIVSTGVASGFQTNGASIGADVTLGPVLLWRSEVRRLWSDAAVWQAHRAGQMVRGNALAVSSLAVTF